MDRRITDEDKERIRELMQKGLSGKEIARELNLNGNTTCIYVTAFKRGFNSLIDYQQYLLKNRGYSSYQDYKKDWAKSKGYSSESGYNRDQRKNRQQRAEYKELSDLIKNKLKELGKSQNWLAKELCITKQAVSQYVHGESFPKEEIQEKLDRILLMSKDDLERRVE